MTVDAAVRRTSIRAQLHSIARRVPDVEAAAVPLRAPEVGRAHVDLEAAGGGELVEVDVVDDERDMVDVHAGAVALEDVDQRGVGDPQGGEQDLTAAPLVEPFG